MTSIEAASISLGIGIGFIYLAFYTMRKLYGRITWRYGPKYVGPAGILQVLADIVKLLLKEDIVPDIRPGYMKTLYALAPIISLGLSISLVALLPYSYHLGITGEIEHSLIWFIVIEGIELIVLVTSSWKLSSKYAYLGSYRGLAQRLSYEAVLILGLLSPAILAGSTSFVGIERAQREAWFILFMPIGFITALIGVMAEVEMPPFDVPEAATEIAGGWSLEYTGPRYLVVFLSERLTGFALLSALAVIYLGGGLGPAWLSPALWVFLKAFLLALLAMIVSAAYHRYSLPGMLEKAWSLWLPLSYANLVSAIILKLITG